MSPATHTCQSEITHFSYLWRQNLNFKSGSLPMAVSDWQRKDQCCEERRCHLPSSILAPWQIFFWSGAPGRGTDRKTGDLSNCCNCKASLLLGNCQVKIPDDIWGHFAANVWLHPAACWHAPLPRNTVAVTAKWTRVHVRHCLKSVSTLAAWRSAPWTFFPNPLESQAE